jgi:hypothetical protein
MSATAARRRPAKGTANKMASKTAKPAARSAGRKPAVVPAVATGNWACLLLLAGWVLTRLLPFTLVLDPGALGPGRWWRAVRPFLENPLPAGGNVFRLCLGWLLCAMLIEAAFGAARAARLFLYFAGGVFAARVLLAGAPLTGSDVGGALSALVLWLLLFRRAPARYAILAVLFALTVLALGVPPLLRVHSVSVLAELAFLYGGLAWLLVRAGARLSWALLGTALLFVARGAARF